MNENIGKKITQEISDIREEVEKKTIGYIIAALGLVCGLAWNEAIEGLIDHFFPLIAQSVWVKLLYAVFLTLLVALVSIYLMRLVKTEVEGTTVKEARTRKRTK